MDCGSNKERQEQQKQMINVENIYLFDFVVGMRQL